MSSTNGLSSYNPLTIDGLSIINADEIYINGQQVNLENYVPYIGAQSDLDMGSQNIKTTHTPSLNADVINKQFLDTTISNLSIAIAGSFLDKVSLTPQTVLGNVLFNSQLSTNSLIVPESKETDLSGVIQVSGNYKRNETDANVTANYRFGSITSSLGIYQSTSTGDFATLGLATVVIGKRYKININVLGELASYNSSIQLYASVDGQNPSQSLGPSAGFSPGSTIFQLLTGTFIPQYQYIILLCVNSSPSGSGLTVKWFGLELFETGVELENITLPLLNASQIPIINDKKQLVGSGVSSTKVIYLDNVSSDIQTQLNSKLNLSGSNANQNINISSYKVQSSATPSSNTDYTNKLYVDNEIINAGALYVKKAGDSMTGTLNMGANTVQSSYVPVSNTDLTNKLYVDTGLSLKGNLSGGNTWYGVQKLPDLTGNRVLVLDNSNNISSSNVSTTELSYLSGTTSSVQTQLNNLSNNFNNYLPLTGGSMTGVLNMGSNAITTTRTPISADDLTRKLYVDTQDAILQNQINLKADLSYVQAEDSSLQSQINAISGTFGSYLPLSGGTMTGDINGTSLNNLRWGRSGDKRNNLAPNDIQGATSAWYFGTYTNDNYTPYADHLILNGWVDTSGGFTNCISYNKGGKGIRQYQGTYGSSSKFSTYYDCVMTDANSGNVEISGSMKANSVNVDSQTASRVCIFDASKNITSSSVSSTTLSFLDATSSIQTQLNDKAPTSYVNAADALRVAKTGDSMSGSLLMTSTNVIEFGAGVVGKDGNAGKIGYETFTTGCLDVVGAGTSGADRRVRIWDKLGVGADPGTDNLRVNGTSLFDGNVSLGSNMITTTTNPTTNDQLTRKGYVDTQLANYLPLTGGTLSGDLTVNGTTTSIGSRLLGSPDSSPGNFWIGLRGSGSELQRLAIGINGDSSTGVVNFVSISKTLNLSSLTGSRALIIDASNNVGSSATTSTELSYLSGTTSSVQTQLDNKASISYVNTQDALKVNKSGDLMTGSLRFSNNIVTEWGSGLTKEPNAGKIGYGWVSGTGLDLVGGGTVAGQRSVVCYDRLGVGIAPTVAFQVSGVGSISSNLGIGLTNPQSLLHLNSTGTHQVRFQTSNVDNHYITAANDLFAFNANLALTSIPNTGRGSCQIILQTPTAGGLIQFMTGAAINTVPSEKMRLTADGNLGIANTGPRAKLDVSGDIITDWNNRRIGVQYLTSTSGYFLGMNTNASTRTLYLDSQSADSPATGAVVIRTGATPTDRVNVDKDGLVSIGAAVLPSANSAGTTTLANYGNACLYRNRLIFSAGLTDWNHCIYNNYMDLDNEGSWDGMKMNVFNGLWVRTGNATGATPATALYIDNDGDLGIGTTSLTHKLTVNGNTGLAGQLDIGVVGNTVPNIKFANSASHIDNNAGEVYLFTGYQGHIAIGRNTNRDSSTANLVLGVAGTEESQIISVKSDNSAYMPMSFASSKYVFTSGFVGIGETNPSVPLHVLRASGGAIGRFEMGNTDSNYLTLNTNGTAGRMFIGMDSSTGTGLFGGGTAYMGWIGTPNNTAFGIATNNAERLRITSTGNVGIGTSTPTCKLDVRGVCEINGTATSITSTSSYGLQHTDQTITVATYVGGSAGGGWIGTKSNHDFHIYTNDSSAQTTFKTNGYVGIGTTNPSSKFHLKDGWMRVDNGDVSTCVYGPNTTWNARLRVGSGTSDYDATTAQIISTSGNLHLDPGYGKDFYLGYYNNNAGSLGTNFIYGDVQLRNKLTVGSGTSRTLMSVSGGSNGGAQRFGNIGDWPVNANGCLYTQDQPSGANSAGLFIGYNGANLAGYTTTLAPGVAWLPYFIHSSEVYVYNNGGLVAYTGGGGWVNVSDEREKEDIQDLKTESSLQRVLALKPKHYRRKYPEDSATPVPQKDKEKRYVGFIAQEVQESNPHCVSTWCIGEPIGDKEDAKSEEDDGVRLGMSYNDYTVHLVGAVQELSKTIDVLTLSKQEIAKRLDDSLKANQEQQKIISEQQKQIEVLTERNKIFEQWAKDQEDLNKRNEEKINELSEAIQYIIAKRFTRSAGKHD